MEFKLLIALFFVGLLAFTAASDDDSNGSDSGSSALSDESGDASRERQEEDCDRLVEGSDDNDGDCDLTKGLEECTDKVEGTPEQKTTIVNFIAILKAKLKVKVSVEERVLIAQSALYEFQNENPDCWELIQYQNISSFGYLASWTLTVERKYQYTKMESLISLDDNDNCPLFDALVECTDGSYEQESAVNALINETLTGICGDGALSAKKKYVLIYQALSEFFSINAEFQFKFFKHQIKGFGCFQAFFQITRTYYQVTQIDVIFEGSVEECQFMISFKNQLTLIFADATISNSRKGLINQFYKRLLQQLALYKSGKARLSCLIKELRGFLKLYSNDTVLVKLFMSIQIEGCGTIWEIIGCGPIRNPSDPKPTLAPQSTMSPMSSSIKPTCACTCEPVTMSSTMA